MPNPAQMVAGFTVPTAVATRSMNPAGTPVIRAAQFVPRIAWPPVSGWASTIR